MSYCLINPQTSSFTEYLRLHESIRVKPLHLSRVHHTHCVTENNTSRLSRKKTKSELSTRVLVSAKKKLLTKQQQNLTEIEEDRIPHNPSFKSRRKTSLSSWMNTITQQTIVDPVKLPRIKRTRTQANSTYSQLLNIQHSYNKYSSLLRRFGEAKVFPKTMKELRRQREQSRKQSFILRKIKQVCE